MPLGRVRPAEQEATGARLTAAVGDLRLLWYLGTVTHSPARPLSLSLQLGRAVGRADQGYFNVYGEVVGIAHKSPRFAEKSLNAGILPNSLVN